MLTIALPASEPVGSAAAVRVDAGSVAGADAAVDRHRIPPQRPWGSIPTPSPAATPLRIFTGYAPLEVDVPGRRPVTPGGRCPDRWDRHTPGVSDVGRVLVLIAVSRLGRGTPRQPFGSMQPPPPARMFVLVFMVLTWLGWCWWCSVTRWGRCPSRRRIGRESRRSSGARVSPVVVDAGAHASAKRGLDTHLHLPYSGWMFSRWGRPSTPGRRGSWCSSAWGPPRSAVVVDPRACACAETGLDAHVVLPCGGQPPPLGSIIPPRRRVGRWWCAWLHPGWSGCAKAAEVLPFYRSDAPAVGVVPGL